MWRRMTHAPHVIDRYVLFDEIASGGMATVHYGRMIGAAGFARTVAIKRLHPQFAKDPEFVSMFLDEARLAARIRHLYVVPTLDVVAHEGELLLVMEYVQGVSLSYLSRVHGQRGEAIPPPVAVGILVNALSGLQAVHDATAEDGTPLDVVHRDVSPQNILVGVDGAARIADFGIAKAMGRLQTTREGQVKGKSGYMAPEQIRGRTIDRRTDVFAASVVLWEVLTGKRLFAADTVVGTMNLVLERASPKPSEVRPSLPQELDAVVLRGLERDPALRYATAHEMGAALEAAVEVASSRVIAAWVQAAAPEVLAARAERVAEIESSTANVAARTAEPAGESLRESAETASASVVERAPEPGLRVAHAGRRAGAVGVLLAVAVAGGALV
jgi:serine/threonine protein kinase